MREACVDSLVGYIELINRFEGRAVCFRGAKDPVDDMRPTVVRSWRRNGRIRAELGERQRLELWRYEAKLIEAFQRRSLPFLETVPDCHLNWLAVAQHYQLPTRLLDWTLNPLVALYFAATDRSLHDSRQGWEDVHVFAWELGDAAEADERMLPLRRARAMHSEDHGLITDDGERSRSGLLLFSPPMISSRIASQEGLFSFEEEISEATFPEAADRAGLRLTHVLIPGAARIGILGQLNRLGFETEKLFPDLPGVCAHQRWAAEWLW